MLIWWCFCVLFEAWSSISIQCMEKVTRTLLKMAFHFPQSYGCGIMRGVNHDYFYYLFCFVDNKRNSSPRMFVWWWLRQTYNSLLSLRASSALSWRQHMLMSMAYVAGVISASYWALSSRAFSSFWWESKSCGENQLHIFTNTDRWFWIYIFICEKQAISCESVRLPIY